MEDIVARSDTRSRHIAASPGEVFAAMSSAERVARWWGPDGFRNTIHTFEFEPGGAWRLTMHGPDGKDYPNESRFVRIVPEHVFEIEHFSGHHFVLTLELVAQETGTRVNWRQTFDTVEHYERIAAFVAGANEQNLERLAAEVLRGGARSHGFSDRLMDDREITTTRLINAPRERVFDAWTDPVHVGHWWGPNGFSTTTHEMRVEVGGGWRFVMHGPDGTDYPNRIVYTEVVRPERLAYGHGDFEREHFKAVVSFMDVAGKTQLTLRLTFPSAEACAAVKARGAVEGGQQTLARFAAYVEQAS